MTLSSVASALLTRRLLAVVGRAPVPQASVLCKRFCFGLCGSGTRRSRSELPFRSFLNADCPCTSGGALAAAPCKGDGRLTVAEVADCNPMRRPRLSTEPCYHGAIQSSPSTDPRCFLSNSILNSWPYM